MRVYVRALTNYKLNKRRLGRGFDDTIMVNSTSAIDGGDDDGGRGEGWQ